MAKKKQRRYPKAFNKYWEEVELCGIEKEDDFKYEAYLAWKAGTNNGPIRPLARKSLIQDAYDRGW